MDVKARISSLAATTLVLSLATTGCVTETVGEAGFDCDRCDSPSDSGDPGRTALVVDGSPEAIGLLGFLNAATTTIDVLDVDVALDRRAAENLISHRNGPDLVFGTADDDIFDDVSEIESVPWVGDSAFERLLAHLFANGLVPAGDDLLGVYDGVPFTVNEAAAVLGFVNAASPTTLDQEVGLDRRAVESIVAARPIASVLALSELYYVAGSALERLKAHVAASGGGPEIGIISDLDKTVIPPHTNTLPDAPYPGVGALYTELELGSGGRAGDMYFVTARQPEGVTEIPAWLDAHGVPTGPIATGVSGVPWLAQAEKVADITAILEAHPGQRFVLFGDSNHVDYRVYGEILQTYPDRIAAALIHRVSNFDESSLAPGIMVYDDYAHAAALLLSLALIDEAAARQVMAHAQAMGLAISDAEIDQLITDHRPR